MGRAPCCEKVGLKKGRWTAEEDEILAKYIAANGEGSWRSLPKDAGLLRCGKSCRLRWINYLRSDLKRGNITKEEEEMIVKLHATLGNRWSLIAGHLPGRTDNEVKNYWNSHLSKRVHVFGRTETESEAALVLDQLSSLPGGGKWRGAGRTSSSTKKTMNNGTNKREKKKDMVVISPTASLVQNHQNQASSVTFDDQITNEGLMDPNEEMVSHLLYTSPGDSRFWDTNADMELVSMDEGDSGVMSLSEERESGAPAGLDVRRGIDVVGKSEEEEGSCRGVKLLDWDLDGMVSKLWDEAGEMWPWIWDSGTGESGLHEGD